VEFNAACKLIANVGRQFVESCVDAAKLFEKRGPQRAQASRLELKLGPQPIDGETVVYAYFAGHVNYVSRKGAKARRQEDFVVFCTGLCDLAPCVS